MVDFKEAYTWREHERTPPASLYRLVVEALPDALIEDPDVDRSREGRDPRAASRPDHLGCADPLGRRRGRAAVRAGDAELEAVALRLASMGSSTSTTSAPSAGSRLYGGGQFELGPGRGQHPVPRVALPPGGARTTSRRPATTSRCPAADGPAAGTPAARRAPEHRSDFRLVAGLAGQAYALGVRCRGTSTRAWIPNERFRDRRRQALAGAAGAGGSRRPCSCSRSAPGSVSARRRSAAASHAAHAAVAHAPIRVDKPPVPRAVPARGARRPRDAAARRPRREDRRVHGAEGLRAEHARGRRQGRERPGRVRLAAACRRSPGRSGAARPYYDVESVVAKVHAAGHVPDRPRRRLRGPDPLGRAAGARAAASGRLALAEQRRPRLGEPVRPAGLALRGRDRRPRPRRPASTRSSSTTCASRATATSRRSSTATSGPSRRARRSRGSSATPSDTLHPLGVRVSADVFGLAATHDLGIGQVPKRIAAVRSTRSTRWSTRRTSRPGEYGITDPDAYPGRTVARALFDFRRQVKGTRGADPLAPGLLARAPLRADRGDRPDRRRAPAARARLHALEPGGRLHAGRAPTGGSADAASRRRRSRSSAPAEREVSFGRIAGRLPRGDVGGRRPRGGEVARRPAASTAAASTSRVVAAAARRDGARDRVRAARHAPSAATVPHVFGLPRSAAPRAVAGDAGRPARSASVAPLARSFPGTSALYVEDLVTGRGARLERAGAVPGRLDAEARDRGRGAAQPRGQARARLVPRLAPAPDADRVRQRRRERGRGDLRRRRRVDELLRGLGIGDTWMGGGYLHGTPALPPIPRRVESQPSFPCCKYTTAYDLARLLTDVHLAAGGRGPLIAALRVAPSRPRMRATCSTCSPTSPTAASSAASSAAARTR